MFIHIHILVFVLVMIFLLPSMMIFKSTASIQDHVALSATDDYNCPLEVKRITGAAAQQWTRVDDNMLVNARHPDQQVEEIYVQSYAPNNSGYDSATLCDYQCVRGVSCPLTGMHPV